MNAKNKQINFIPDEFESYGEAGEFWDTHDTTDYLDSFETISVEGTKLSRQHIEVEIDSDLLEKLSQQAQQKGVGISQLVNQMLRETLSKVR